EWAASALGAPGELPERAQLCDRPLRGRQQLVGAAHERRDLGDRQRPADEIALGKITAEAAQQAPCLGLLDPLGDHLEAERMAELDGRGDDARGPAERL